MFFLADVFENFKEICLEIHELDPVKFISAPGLARPTAWKKTEVELDLLNDIDILLVLEKGIREGICNSIHWHAKANNKFMKSYEKYEK